MVAKKDWERDIADKISEVLLNRFRLETKRQRDDESIDRFLDNIKGLRRRRDQEESTKRRNYSMASKFVDGVKDDNLRALLATNYKLSRKIGHQLRKR